MFIYAGAGDANVELIGEISLKACEGCREGGLGGDVSSGLLD